MEKPLKSKLKIRTAIFSCSILFLVIILFLIQNHENGSFVIVNVDGVKSTYSLNEDMQIALNNGTNTLVIEDGYVYMLEANCPDHICIKQGKINKKGQTITCLPNKITVSISSDDDIDIIN